MENGKNDKIKKLKVTNLWDWEVKKKKFKMIGHIC